MRSRPAPILPNIGLIVRAIFFLVLIFISIRLLRFHYRLIIYPFPAEYREGANLFITDLMLHSINPYQIDQMPLAVNSYGIGYPLLVYPFARLLGSTFFVHRTVTGICVILSCLLLFVVMLREGTELFYSLAAALILYAALLFHTTPLARPDGLGMLLFLSSAFLPQILKNSRGSMLFSGALGVLAFFTKAYFVASLAYVASYTFLFVSKKTALGYALYSLLLLITSSLAVNWLWPTYFLNAIWVSASAAGHDFNYMLHQLAEFWRIYLGVILLVLIAQGYRFFHALLPGSIASATQWIREGLPGIWSGPLQGISLDKPLLATSLSFSTYSFLLSFALIFFWLGRHTGNWMVYLYQLMSPFLLVLAGNVITRLKAMKGRYEEIIAYYSWLLAIPLILFTLARAYSSTTAPASRYDNTAWRKVEQLIASHHNIMNSPVLTGLLVSQHKPVYDSGWSEYFTKTYYPEGLLSELLPAKDAIDRQWVGYEDFLASQIRNRDFDLVLISNNRFRVIPRDLLPQYYVLTGSIFICMPQTYQCVRLQVWLPKGQ